MRSRKTPVCSSQSQLRAVGRALGLRRLPLDACEAGVELASICRLLGVESPAEARTRIRELLTRPTLASVRARARK